MKKIKIFLILFSFFTLSVEAGFNYPYNCNDAWCYSTNFGELQPNSSTSYYMTDISTIDTGGFTSYMNIRLSEYINYYGNDQFVISNFYTGGPTNPFNKTFTLSSLLSYNLPIYIGKPALYTYQNGRDYLFSNFTNVINALHTGYPLGDKKNKLSNLIPNIVYYDSGSNQFAVRNVCSLTNCYTTNYWFIPYNSVYNYKFLNGTVKPNTTFITDNFKVTDDYSVSDYFMKSGDALNFNFGFSDYLDVSKLTTQYKYTISYKYAGEPAVDFLTETINISKTFGVTSPNINAAHIDSVVSLTILNSDLKKIRVGINESIKLTKPGKVTFYLTVENISSGDKFEKSQVNFAPVVVLPSDDVQSGEAFIESSFSKSLNDIGFNIGDTFSVSLSLKDLYGNNHYDYIDGYEVSLSSGTSTGIELAKVGSSVYSSTLIGVKTNEYEPYYISFKFRVKTSGYHALTGFNVKVREKKTNYIYSPTPKYYTISNVFPSNMYDGVTKMKIYIKPPSVSDFNITCSKGPIILKSLCTSDNLSGCNNSMNQTLTFTGQSQNGSSGVLTIKDYAYNQKSYNYTMNHIDQTAPTIGFYKGLTHMSGSVYKYKANDDDLVLKFYEWTTSNCNPEIHYLVKVNGTTVYNQTQNVSSYDFLFSDFFKNIGTKNLYVKATDKYGNFSEQTVSFTIYPNMFDATQSSLVSNSDSDKYANNSDFYIYTALLRDKFGNPISNKNVISFDQSCVGSSSVCKTLLVDMVNSTGGDALIEYDYTAKTDVNGKISFKVRSLTPGSFDQRFKIVMKEWDDTYEDISSTQTFYESMGSDRNSFKKPFYGILHTSKDGIDYTEKPEIGTQLFYRVSIESIPSMSSIPISLSDYKNYVRPIDVNTSIQSVTNIDDLHSKKQIFKARIDTSLTATSLGQPGVKIANSSNLSPIEISYVLGGENVKYYLSEDDVGDSRKILSIENAHKKFLGVKVIGNLQGSGKQTITGQKSNFSDISKSDMRNSIRKSAYEYIKNMSPNSSLNGVKYVVGDISISGVVDYETLIVKDGNVKISGNLSPSGTYKKLGIIVLKDNYKVESGYAQKGNIYVYPGVKSIQATLYADGGLISVDSFGNPYVTDTPSRSNALNNQLILYGTLFTRNTIGGGIIAGGSYVLPGGAKVSNFDTAMIYDLNYLRRGNIGCDKNANLSCTDAGEYEDVFVIKYDSNIQSNPPKLFK